MCLIGYQDSIRFLFATVGYLRNNSVLTNDLYWPDQADQYPLFHGESTPEKEKR